jgi:hypothetical protein
MNRKNQEVFLWLYWGLGKVGENDGEN